ncbi:MAG TPA: hypothetical protein PKJ51_08000, partial [Methanothrix sp.]|nr:hypothetical protein [Methanothrix sp.]
GVGTTMYFCVTFGLMPSSFGEADNNPFPPSPGAFCHLLNQPSGAEYPHLVIWSSHHILSPQPDPPSSTPPPRPT